MKTLILTIATLSLMSCSNVKNVPTADEIQKQIDRVTMICNSVKMISDAGVDIPGVEQCETIVPRLNSGDVKVILDVLGCVSVAEPGTKAFAICAVDNGYDPVKEKIEELRE